MNKQKKPKLRLTNRNIRARYLLEKEINKDFTLEKMGEMFMVHKQHAFKWCRILTDETGKEVSGPPNPLPKGARAKAVMEWINDGALLKVAAK